MNTTPQSELDEPRRAAAVQALIHPDRLRSLFAPSNIALVGASDNSGWSRNIVDSLEKVRFSGRWTPVHPARDEVLGRPAVRSLRNLSDPVDLAYILAPQHAIGEVLEDAGAAGVHYAILLSAGYGESGEVGRLRQQELVDLAIEHDITLLGPNGLGFVNAHAMVAPFGLTISEPLKAGGVGLILQSGALAMPILGLHRARSVGISLLVSMGNEALIQAADVIDYLIEDVQTRAICLFLEGIRDAARFARAAVRAIEAGKPVVAMKVGASPEGQRTAFAHTGAVAGDDEVTDAAFRQFGVIRVRSLEEMVVTAGLLAEGPHLGGRRAGVITGSGGCNNFIVDRANDLGIEIPAFAQETVTQLEAETIPAFGSALNPVDVTGAGLSQTAQEETEFSQTMRIVAADPYVDFVLFMGVYIPETAPIIDRELLEARIRRLSELMVTSPVPIVAITEVFTSIEPYQREVLERFGIHLVGGMHFGMIAIGHALRWHDTRREAIAMRSDEEEPAKRDDVALTIRIQESRNGPWAESDARDLLRNAGVPLVPAIRATTPETAVAAAQLLGLPVAIKVHSRGLAHKTDVGGVQLNVSSTAGVAEAVNNIFHEVSTRRPDVEVDGVLVSPMRVGGIELLVGVTRDSVFGLTLAVGLGGIWVEVLHDVSLRVLPVSRRDVASMLGELKGLPLLNGYRGATGVDIGRVITVVTRIAALAAELEPVLESLEVNPLWCNGDQIEALDIVVATNASRSTSDSPPSDMQRSGR